MQIEDISWLPVLALLMFRFVLMGLAWSWLVPVTKMAQGRFSIWLTQMAVTLLLGTLCSSLLVLFLAEIGHYSRLTEGVVGGLITLLGLLLGARKSLPAFGRHLAENLPGAGLVLIGMITVLLLPRCSEWVMGGWDPGVYLNQGVYVASTGTFHPPPDPLYAALDEDAFAQFTRGNAGYTECFPGIAIDPDTRAFQHYFFRLTPSAIAAMATGGLRLATRVNYFFGLFSAVIFAGALLLMGASRRHVVFSVLIFVSHPLWLYHLHIPTSEMLHLCLVGGLAVLLPCRQKGGGGVLALLGLTMFAAMLNRISFLPFGGLLCVLAAWADRDRRDRGRVCFEHGVMLIAVLAGLLFDHLASGITVVRIAHVVGLLERIFGVCAVVTVLADLFLLSARMRGFLNRLLSFPWRKGLTSVALLGLALMAFSAWQPLRDLSGNWAQIFPYLGWGAVLMACLGAICIAWNNEDSWWTLFVTFWALVTVSILMNNYTSGVFPWTSRRYLVYTLPLIAALAGYPLACLWGRAASVRNPWWVYGGATGVLLLVMGMTAKTSWHAFNRVEYTGVTAALALVAEQIDDDDVVVVDAPTWGTPLKLIYGKNIINGKHIWNLGKDPPSRPSVMPALQGLANSGKRIRFLTTTPLKALAIYPDPVTPVTEDWVSQELIFEEIIHSTRARDFEMRQIRHVLRLYTWQPPSVSSLSATAE